MKLIDCSELVFLNDAIYQATKKILADALPDADPTWLALSAQALFQDVAGVSKNDVIATLQQANQVIADRESTLDKDGSYRVQGEVMVIGPTRAGNAVGPNRLKDLQIGDKSGVVFDAKSHTDGLLLQLLQSNSQGGEVSDA